MFKMSTFFGSLLLSGAFCLAMEPDNPETMFHQFKGTYPHLTEHEFSEVYLDCEGDIKAITGVLNHKNNIRTAEQKRGGPALNERSIPIFPSFSDNQRIQLTPDLMRLERFYRNFKFKIETRNHYPSLIKKAYLQADWEILARMLKGTSYVDIARAKVVERIDGKILTNAVERIDIERLMYEENIYHDYLIDYFQKCLKMLEDDLYEHTGKIYLHTPLMKLSELKGNHEITKVINNSNQANKPSLEPYDPEYLALLESRREQLFDHIGLLINQRNRNK